MDIATHQRLTVTEFLAWTARQAAGKFELVEGQIVQAPFERLSHIRVKFRVAKALDEAIRAAGLGAELLTDGATVPIDDRTAFEPDALVYAGDPLPGDDILVPNPIVVVEVLSPSSEAIDTGRKLSGYFSIASVRHYLIVDAEARTVVHHERVSSSKIETRIVTAGLIKLDPPGLAIEAGVLFG